jgi:hypothetical protein
LPRRRAAPAQHRASTVCAVPARAAFRFLCDGRRLGRWALGCFAARRIAPGLYRGRSLFDGEILYVRPVGDEKNLAVHYFVGTSRRSLVARAWTRVQKLGPRRCRVSLVAQRVKEMSLARWKRLMVTHEVEILLIKSQLER